MGRKERMNIGFGLLVIVLAISGIAILLAQFFKPDNRITGATKVNYENTNTASTTTQAVTATTTNDAVSASAISVPTFSPSLTPTPMPPFIFLPVKGLYLTPISVDKKDKIQHYVDLANTTEINAYVIDVKDDLGEICYETRVPLAVKHEAWEKKYDVKLVLNTFHENNIKVIGRVVCFSDPLMPLKEPGMSLKNASGSVFKVPHLKSHLAWLDPSNEDAWQYIIDISKEALELGFDEIQYDYIRFPETTNFKYDMSYLEREKSDYINDFMRTATDSLYGSTLSGDIFGSVCIQSRDAGGIGQTLETISRQFEYISPMIYPSHYANDSENNSSGNGMGTNINGILYKKPDLEPYKITYNTLAIAKRRLENADLEIRVRPYLQGFTADYMPEGYYIKYGVEEYRAQIQAVYDAGYSEWIFWNSRNTYVEKAFLPVE